MCVCVCARLWVYVGVHVYGMCVLCLCRRVTEGKRVSVMDPVPFNISQK